MKRLQSILDVDLPEKLEESDSEEVLSVFSIEKNEFHEKQCRLLNEPKQC